MLPRPVAEFLIGHAHGLDALALIADLFLTYPPDEIGLDPVATKRALAAVYNTIGRYFRLTVLHSENVPRGRALIVGCHSGVLPWDAACLVSGLYLHTGRFSRNTGDFLFERFGWIERFLGQRGTVVGRPKTIERLLENEQLVVLFPGGAKDMERPFWERYRVKAHRGFARGRGGYIRSALRTRSPIVPVAIVGAEETHLMIRNLPSFAKKLGVPYFPVVLSAFPLPARIYVRFGKPISLEGFRRSADDQALVDELNEKVRTALQDLIDDTVLRRRGIYWSSYDDS